MTKKIIEREKRVVLPGLFFDNQKFVPAETYPAFTIFTDTFLAETLMVSVKRVEMWRKANVIPFRMNGKHAVYDLNAVIVALKAAGYSQDKNLKSVK